MAFRTDHDDDDDDDDDDDCADGVEEETVLVIPSTIDKENIRTVGDWSNFNLTWDTDTQVNHGTIFYKLFLQIGKEQIHKVCVGLCVCVCVCVCERERERAQVHVWVCV